MPWYRGNTHTHTTASDGNVPIADAVRWYATHGYDWLAITDHNCFGPTEPIELDLDRPFLTIPGSEISMQSEKLPVHLCALNPRANPAYTNMPTIVQTLQAGVDRTRSLGGVPIINHPNWNWAFTDWHMAQVSDWNLLEIFNASTDCNNFGAGGRPSVEDLWDNLLTRGMRVYAVAADDSHNFGVDHVGHVSPPGLGWVTVRANELSTEAILGALQRGDFYASTEIVLADYEVVNGEIRIQIEQRDSYAYTTRFIGAGGRVLSECYGTEVRYRLRGDEQYVRARIHSSNGGFAWTQPVFRGGVEAG